MADGQMTSSTPTSPRPPVGSLAAGVMPSPVVYAPVARAAATCGMATRSWDNAAAEITKAHVAFGLGPRRLLERPT